jgi:hypothetical protein
MRVIPAEAGTHELGAAGRGALPFLSASVFVGPGLRRDDYQFVMTTNS